MDLENESNIFDNKIIVLYILNNSSKPLSIDQIIKLCEEFDDITYFDIYSYIQELKKNKFIDETLENSTMTYFATELGKNTLKELVELIPGVNIHNIKKSFNKNMIEVKRDFSVDTSIHPLKDDKFKVSCYIKEGNDELINISVYATSKDQAKNISRNWNEKFETIYSTLLDFLTNEEKTEE